MRLQITMHNDMRKFEQSRQRDMQKLDEARQTDRKELLAVIRDLQKDRRFSQAASTCLPFM